MSDTKSLRQMSYQEIKSHVSKLEAEIEEMQEDADFLEALRAAGVDNWNGYDIAMELMDE